MKATDQIRIEHGSKERNRDCSFGSPPIRVSAVVQPWLILFSLCVLFALCGENHFSAAQPGQKGKPTRVAKITGFIQHLQWSPDGKKFLFTRSNFGGKMGLWTINADGAELTQLLPKANTPHFDGSWSPDSKRILFVYDILQGISEEHTSE